MIYDCDVATSKTREPCAECSIYAYLYIPDVSFETLFIFFF